MKVQLPVLILALLMGVPAGVFPQAWTPRGITEPYKDATLSTTVAGMVAVINCKEGEAVKQGEVILELEREEQTLEVERRRLIAESKVEVDAARHRVETLETDLEATRQLFQSTRSVSFEELQQKELEHKLARAELERLLVAEEREQLEYRIAQAQLQKRIIRAPFDGVIVKVFLEVGENCNPQEPLIRIADTSKCRLVVHMEAAVSRQLRPDMSVKIKIEGVANPNILLGTVEYVSPLVDPSSGLREVKVLFDNREGHINPGLTGTLLLK